MDSHLLSRCWYSIIANLSHCSSIYSWAGQIWFITRSFVPLSHDLSPLLSPLPSHASLTYSISLSTRRFVFYCLDHHSRTELLCSSSSSPSSSSSSSCSAASSSSSSHVQVVVQSVIPAGCSNSNSLSNSDSDSDSTSASGGRSALSPSSPSSSPLLPMAMPMLISRGSSV